VCSSDLTPLKGQKMNIVRPCALLFALVLVGCSSDESTNLLAPPDTVPPAEIADLSVSWASDSSVNLTWTATGDNGTTGTAQNYELRMSDYPADPFGWQDWEIVTLTGKPLAPGQTQSHAVSGLSADAVHVFRLMIHDAAGNSSGPSNPIIATVAPQHDSTAPGAISDLATWSSDGTHLEVTWTASGDDGPLGQAASFEIKYHSEAITLANWEAASAGPGGSPGPSGQRVNANITGLTADTVYHVAVRMSDERGNQSLLSNSLLAETIIKDTWYVKPDGSGDVATVQAAINVAKAGDTIVVAAGTYSWTSQGTDDLGVSAWGMLFFNRDVQHIYLRSEAGPEMTILDMEGKGRGMNMIGYNDGVVIEGFTFTNGDATLSVNGLNAGGAILMHLSSPTLRNCIFVNNRGVQGGGVANIGQNTAVIENCKFINNSGD